MFMCKRPLFISVKISDTTYIVYVDYHRLFVEEISPRFLYHLSRSDPVVRNSLTGSNCLNGVRIEGKRVDT